MLETSVIDPKELSHEELQAYQEMATWRYAKDLNPQSDQPYTFIALHENQDPKGLCVCELSRTRQLCDIKKISIHPSVDYQRALKAMMGGVEELSKKKKLTRITIEYIISSDNHDLDEFLDADGWTSKMAILKHYLFACRSFDPRWLERLRPLPKHLQIITWKEMSPAYRDSLLQTINGGALPIYLTPFYWDEYRQELNTLLLVADQKVIGWSATHTFPDTPETIHYSSLYIHPMYRFHGYSIHLLAESIKRHIKEQVKYGVFEVSLQKSSKSWKRFIERHLAPYSEKEMLSVRRFKTLC